jgi:hypothetical protein
MPGQQLPPAMGPLGPEFMPASKQKKHGHKLLIWLILATVLLAGSIGFGVWAYMERQDYKENVDQKIADAIEVAGQEISTEKDNEFREKEKEPFKNYKSPATFGSVEIVYPKTWSAFVTETDRGGTPVDGYFHPDFVPGIQSGTQFALRLEVVNRAYDQELRRFDSAVRNGKVNVAPYRVRKTEGVLGSRIDGEINAGQNDFMVMFPMRDKTLKIWTESESFLKDFDDIILPNLVFVP